MLASQAELAPLLAEYSAEWDPMMAVGPQLAYEQALLGGPERELSYFYVDPWSKEATTRKFTMPGTRGTLGMLTRQVAPSLARTQRKLWDIYSPGGSAMLDELISQRAAELRNPYAIAPGLRREIEQASLGDAALRGFGRSPFDAYNTLSALGSEGEARANARRAAAGGLSEWLAGLSQNTMQMGAGMTMPGLNMARTRLDYFNPWNSYGNAVYGGNQQIQQQNEWRNKDLWASGIMSDSNSLAGWAQMGAGMAI